MDASNPSQWPSQFRSYYMGFGTPGHHVYLPDRARLEQEATAQVNAELPAPGAYFFNGSGLPVAPPSSLPVGVNAWAGTIAQANQFPVQAAIEPYANVSFVQQPIPTQHPIIPQQFFAPQWSFVPQQPVAPHQATVPQRFPVPQQPSAPQGFFVPQQTAAPQQPVAFQPAVASQQHFVPQQLAPQTTAATAPAATTSPQVLAVPPAVPSSKPLPSSIGAVYLFGANVRYNKERRSLGLRTWREIADVVPEEDLKNPTKRPVQLVNSWEESLLYMGKQDFQAYYYKQRKLARAYNTPLPVLPDWIAKFAFGDKVEKKHQSPITARAAATMLLKRSRGAASSGPQSKGKRKARATPYPRTGASTRPSPLVN
ncbi:hypothetical protein FRC06_003482 [Ceratobasidium sp. 370]|nr:hypothetical protein FRC06_003482 [Ceratobasidium sp. 370]